MATTTISALTAVTAPNLTDVSVFEVEDVNTNSRKVAITQLRVQINTGAQVFTAGATFAGAVSGITTLAGTGAVSGFTTLTLTGLIQTTVASGYAAKLIKTTGAALAFEDGTNHRAAISGINGADGLAFGNGTSDTEVFRYSGTTITVASGVTTAVQALTATSGTFSVGSALPITLNRTEVGAALMGMIVIERASTVKGYLGLSAGDLISFIDSSATFNNFTISDAGAGTFRAGISCTTGTFSGAFGCNGNTAQTKAVSGGTLAGVIAALVANGILSS